MAAVACSLPHQFCGKDMDSCIVPGSSLFVIPGGSCCLPMFCFWVQLSCAVFLHLCDWNTPSEPLPFIWGEQYNKYEEKNILKKKSLSAHGVRRKNEHKGPCLRDWEFILLPKSLCWNKGKKSLPEYFPVPTEGRCESHPAFAGWVLATSGVSSRVFSLQLSCLKAAFIFVVSGKMWNLRSKS